MRKITTAIILTIILTSCSKSFVQVYETASTNTNYNGDYFVYETDTVKITYGFWAIKGIMSMAVYNKLDKPIYIDWKNSSFIYNDNKLNYWVEETKTNYLSYYGGYFYSGPLIKPGFTINEGLQSSLSQTVKPERITFIPPKSNYYRSQFYLLPNSNYKFDVNSKPTSVSRNDDPKKKTNIYSIEFLSNNTPLTFRNYLAFSFAETTQQYFFVDNNFYLKRVDEMDARHFRKARLVNNQIFYDVLPQFHKQNCFYIELEKGTSVEERK